MSYTHPLPNLKDYDVSSKTGFLPEGLPLETLPPYYNPWERIAQVIPALLLTKRIRSVVDKLPILSTDNLHTEPEFRRAYSILSFIAHAYIWGINEPENKLPESVANPWIKVSDHLRLPPIATYAGLCLWNYKLIMPDVDEYSEDDFLNNVQTITTYTGSLDESWFYLVSVYFESIGAPCITIGLDAIENARNNQPDLLVENLKKLAELIDHLGSVLMRMEEMCDPHVFYFKLRPYLAGWKNMEAAGLENGVYYGNESKPRVYSGGSNAQSSLIQTLDLILNVDHFSTGESSTSKTSTESENPFMKEMREYMPGKHADFLIHLSKINVIRDYVTKNSQAYPELILAYDASVAMLKSFRDKHIQIVTRYIVIQAQKSKSMGSSTTKTLRAGLAKTPATKDSKDLKGTGGTSLLPFLKQCRDETGNAAAGSWGKRILTYKTSKLVSKRPELEQQQQQQQQKKPSFLGMAGQWRNDGDDTAQGHW